MMMKKPPLYLVIDQGGQSSRALVFNKEGDILTQGSHPIKTIRNGPDKVEHVADEILSSIHASIDLCLDGIDPELIESIGLACQRSSIVCWDKTSGSALSPVLSWQDRRAGESLDKLSAQAEIIHSSTGLFLSPHYGASKLRWCLEHLPAVNTAREEGRLAFGPLSSFILFNLLEEHPFLVDPVCASRTLLWNLGTRDWDQMLLDLFKIPLSCLPHCVPNQFAYGHMKIASCAIPLKVSTGDQPAALFMSGPPDKDTIYINIGTGAFLQSVVNIKALITPTLLSSVVWQSDNDINYVLEGTVNGAASALQQIGEELSVSQLEMHELLSDGLRIVKTPPLFLNGVSGVGSPFWLPDLKSEFIGEGNKTEKLVAVVESIVFLIQANLDEMTKHIDAPKRIVVSGGLSALDGLCQRLASISGLPLERTENQEATARGLAYLLSMSSTFEGVSHSKFMPGSDLDLEQRYEQWYKYMNQKSD
ncbi:MAG: glycerol kinase [Gammaproteobacteria bacterium]|jgi:glycerol kinase